jgi:imidazolonepropionase-like amidohydrolase
MIGSQMGSERSMQRVERIEPMVGSGGVAASAGTPAAATIASRRCGLSLSVACLWLLLAGGPAVWGQSETPTPGVEEPDEWLIEAEVLYTMRESEPLRPGRVLVRGGQVVAVGAALESATARLVKVPCLMPGLIDAASTIGSRPADDEVTDEITPELDVLQSLDLEAAAFAEALAEGITTAHITPGTSNVFCGQSGLVKTAGPTGPQLWQRQVAGFMAICSDPTARNRSRGRPDSIYMRQPTNRMGVVWIVRAQLDKARRSEQLEARLRLPAARQAALERLLLDQQLTMTVARTGHDLLTVLELAEEFGFQPTIVGGDESYQVLDQLAAAQVAVIYTAMTTGSAVGRERTDLRWNVPGKLEERDIRFALAEGRLLEQAQFAVRFGCTRPAALRAITRWPAELLGVGDRVGCIATGYAADLLALSGDPLEMTSRPLWTMVDGSIRAGEIEPEVTLNDADRAL